MFARLYDFHPLNALVDAIWLKYPNNYNEDLSKKGKRWGTFPSCLHRIVLFNCVQQLAKLIETLHPEAFFLQK